eukprot:8331734-Karenia_brevis.AAC.1
MISEWSCGIGDEPIPSSMPRHPSRVARCQRCQRRLQHRTFLCNECQRVFCRCCVVRTTPSTYVCDACRGSGSDACQYVSGGSNPASVGVGHCLGLAVHFGGYDWIHQTRTNNILFAAEYATADSGTPLNAGNDVFSDLDDDDALIRAYVQ